MVEPLVFVTDAYPAVDAAIGQVYSMKKLIQFIIFFTLVKTYQRTLNPSFLVNIMNLLVTFINAVTIYVKNFFIKNGLNLPKSILVLKII